MAVLAISKLARDICIFGMEGAGHLNNPKARTLCAMRAPPEPASDTGEEGEDDHDDDDDDNDDDDEDDDDDDDDDRSQPQAP
eukprot:6405061-Pyramimonas_sp.AAC.1